LDVWIGFTGISSSFFRIEILYITIRQTMYVLYSIQHGRE